MKIPTLGAEGGPERLDTDDLVMVCTHSIPPPLDQFGYSATFVVVNPQGVVNSGHSEERALELMQAHAGHGWRWGLMIFAPKENGGAVPQRTPRLAFPF